MPKGEKPDGGRYRLLLTTALENLFEVKRAGDAVKRLFDRGAVGMKTNCIARRNNSTPVALVEALGDVLEESGIEANDIVIWERTNRELEAAGFKLNASNFGRRCLGTDSKGFGYGRKLYSSGNVSSLISNILTDLINYNINVTVLKDHSLAGLSGGLKNMYGAIHNPNKYHDDNCDPFAAHVNNLEPIRARNRLTIIDAHRVQFHGGPGYDSRFLQPYGGLIISNDPVAADRVALEILEKVRRKNGKPSLAESGRPVKYLASAEKIGLGTATMEKIALNILEVQAGGRVSRGGEL